MSELKKDNKEIKDEKEEKKEVSPLDDKDIEILRN